MTNIDYIMTWLLKFDSEVITKFLHLMKCDASLSSFVNIPELLFPPAIWLTLIVSSWSNSPTEFSLICKKNNPFVIRFLDNLTDASLSLYIWIGNCMNELVTFKSWIRWIICDNDSQHSSVVYISTSVELWAVFFCRFEDQCKVPPSHIRNPDSDLDLNNSSKTSG